MPNECPYDNCELAKLKDEFHQLRVDYHGLHGTNGFKSEMRKACASMKEEATAFKDKYETESRSALKWRIILLCAILGPEGVKQLLTIV